jgi:hypothetical protein
LTLEQIIFFYDEFQKEDIRGLRNQAVNLMQVLGAALGGDKDRAFRKYMDSLDIDKTLDESMEEGRRKGLAIEDK